MRVVDTRTTHPVGEAGTLTVDLGPYLPAGAVGAVVINLTTVDSTAAGYLTAYPDGTARPNASSLNRYAGEVRANSVTVALPSTVSDKRIAIFNNAGTTDVVVDLFGYYVGTGGNATGAASYYPLANPVRAWDSRDLGAGGPLGPGQSHTIQTAINLNGQAVHGVRAVAINLTAVEPDGPGYLRAWNGNPGAVPAVSTLNFSGRQIIPNFAVVPVTCVNAPTCTTFSFAVASNVSTTDVVVDVAGIYADPSQTGATYFVPNAPYRVVDTRVPQGFGRLTSGQSGQASIGAGGGKNPVAANLNVTAVNPTSPTYVTVYASNQPLPTASNLNPVPGEAAPNAAQPLLGPNGTFRVFDQQAAGLDIVVDVEGSFHQDG